MQWSGGVRWSTHKSSLASVVNEWNQVQDPTVSYETTEKCFPARNNRFAIIGSHWSVAGLELSSYLSNCPSLGARQQRLFCTTLKRIYVKAFFYSW